MTKIDIISGFLGAGKTTLIKKLVKEAYAGEKLVLIENEFGEIGIDGGFLSDAGINITEMNSGCICCSLVGDFGRALEKVLDEYKPNRILIEPSGVGKLSDVIRAVKGINASDAVLNSFTTVCDAGKCKMYIKNFGEFYVDQVESASAIILSHTGGMSEEKIEKAVALIREKNAEAVIVTTPWEELDGAKLRAAMEGNDSLKNELEQLISEQRHHHHHDDDDEECGCGHHHHHDDDDEECGCGHHHHHDDDDEECGCGHHHHHDDDDEECGCGHHHHHDDDDEECGCGHHHHHDDDDEECGCGHHHHHDDDDEECGCGHHHHHDDDDEECGCGHHHHHDDDDEECGCGHHHHHHHADEVFTSWGKETAKRYSDADIEKILEALENESEYGMILRAKGIVMAEDGGWIHFDYVPGEPDVRRGSASVIGRICVIGSKTDEDKLAALFGIA